MVPVGWWGVTVGWGVNKEEAGEQLRLQSLACLQSRRRKEPKKRLKRKYIHLLLIILGSLKSVYEVFQPVDQNI